MAPHGIGIAESIYVLARHGRLRCRSGMVPLRIGMAKLGFVRCRSSYVRPGAGSALFRGGEDCVVSVVFGRDQYGLSVDGA